MSLIQAEEDIFPTNKSMEGVFAVVVGSFISTPFTINQQSPFCFCCYIFICLFIGGSFVKKFFLIFFVLHSLTHTHTVFYLMEQIEMSPTETTTSSRSNKKKTWKLLFHCRFLSKDKIYIIMYIYLNTSEFFFVERTNLCQINK